MKNMGDQNSLENRIQASLIGGAIGDALGYTVEFMAITEIYAKFGASGIKDLQPDRRTGMALISDDTQMTLFTADGLLWALSKVEEPVNMKDVPFTSDGLYPSYLRWYNTQQGIMPTERDQELMKKQPHEQGFSLLDQPGLFARRAPGNTCISALASGVVGSMEKPLNESKGCGGVMRVAPIGLLLHNNPGYAFQVAAEAAAITHGHASGYLAAGAFATIVAELINEKEISEGVETALGLLKHYRYHEETSKAIERAVNFAKNSERPENAIIELGEGWVAEEALAIGIYCAMKRKEFKAALIMAVNHSGDSDSTGAITGTLLGAYGGMKVVPDEWKSTIELSEVILTMGSRLAQGFRKLA